RRTMRSRPRSEERNMRARTASCQATAAVAPAPAGGAADCGGVCEQGAGGPSLAPIAGGRFAGGYCPEARRRKLVALTHFRGLPYTSVLIRVRIMSILQGSRGCRRSLFFFSARDSNEDG